jgi:hypothetical protein
MASMTLRTDLVALTVAAVSTFVIGALALPSAPVGAMSESRAREEASVYLGAAPARAELRASKWEVSDGHDTAWIDARTGDLVEIEFAAP